MSMEVVNLIQGSDEWNQFRIEHYPASEAPVVMGAGKFEPKTPEDLALVRLGVKKIEISDYQQMIFDDGHEAEFYARPLIEMMIEESFSPITGRKPLKETPELAKALSASLDGVTFDGRLLFEHKIWNDDLAKQVVSGNLDPFYYWQLEQQLLVSGAEKVVFVTSDSFRVDSELEAKELKRQGKLVSEQITDHTGTYWAAANDFKFCYYSPVAGRAEALVDGWKNFESIVGDVLVDDPTWNQAAEKVRPLLQELEDARKKVKELTAMVEPYKLSMAERVKSSGSVKTIGSGVEVAMSVRKGSLDEQKLKDALKVDSLDQFRKDETYSWKIKRLKDEISDEELLAAKEKQSQINPNPKSVKHISVPTWVQSGRFAF